MRGNLGSQIFMGLHTCNGSLWMVLIILNYPSFSQRDEHCEGPGNAEKTLRMTLLVEALTGASQPPPKLDGKARASAPRNCCFGGKKTNPVLIRKGCISRERREKKKNKLSKKPGSSVVWRVTHPRCRRKYWAPRGLFRPIQNLIAPVISVSTAKGSSQGREDPFARLKALSGISASKGNNQRADENDQIRGEIKTAPPGSAAARRSEAEALAEQQGSKMDPERVPLGKGIWSILSSTVWFTTEP